MTPDKQSNTNLCSVNELSDLIELSHSAKESQSQLKILDCSWYMPSQQIDTAAAYAEQHICGARFFHIDKICDESSAYQHMLPTPGQFSSAVEALGVCSQSKIVVYDSAGLFSAARVWWMFRAFGHNDIRVLDGGLPAWVEMGQHVEGTTSDKESLGDVANSRFIAKDPSEFVVSLAQMKENSQSGESLVLDARSRGRFLGQLPEPRPGLASGHMPNSISLSYDELISEGRLKDVSALKQIFTNRGITSETPLISSCGSGVTAAIITLALDECGFGLHRLYDGSWSQWASQDDTTILTA